MWGKCRAEDAVAARSGLTGQTTEPGGVKVPVSIALLLASGCQEDCHMRLGPARGPSSPSGWRVQSSDGYPSRLGPKQLDFSGKRGGTTDWPLRPCP